MNYISKFSQKGYVNLLLILILIIGIIAGVYLIKKPTNIFPKAYEKDINTPAEKLINPHIYSNGKFGIAIDIKRADKIPNTDQLTTLSPGWVRLEYKPGYEIPIFPKDIKTLVIFDYVSVDDVPWEGDDSDWQIYTDKFIAGLEEFMKNYGDRFNVIEVWNEEDVCYKDFYCPYVSPAIFANILKRASFVIKQLSPKTTVVMGGMASDDAEYLKQVLKTDPNVLDQVDAVGMHIYKRTLNNWCSAPQAGCAEILTSGDLKESVEKYKAVLPANVKIWVTETGQQTTDLEWQKKYMQMVFDYLQNEADVIIWYAWTDLMSDRDSDANMGLYNKNGEIKPAGELFKTYSTSNL